MLRSYGHFPYGGRKGAQPHTIAFGGVFPNKRLIQIRLNLRQRGLRKASIALWNFGEGMASLIDVTMRYAQSLSLSLQIAQTIINFLPNCYAMQLSIVFEYIFQFWSKNKEKCNQVYNKRPQASHLKRHSGEEKGAGQARYRISQ